MRKSIAFAVMALALCGCATSAAVDEQAALASCQAVGIGERDPQFATCVHAQIQGRRETKLEHAYDNAKHIVPNDMMSRHADETF